MTTAPLSNDARAIEELRSKLGGRLTIVGHHYEQEATIQHCDIRGDSLELARRVPGIASDYIVFCGVYFMAESAALLAREGQQVLLPDHSADCVMAQMTPARSKIDHIICMCHHIQIMFDHNNGRSQIDQMVKNLQKHLNI